MTSRATPPRFDPSSIAFPTDKVTLAEMRRHEPNVFQLDLLRTRLARELEVVATHFIELTLSERAYELASGIVMRHKPIIPHKELVSDLNDAYKRYGLSTGMHQTKELVSAFERHAAEQAPNVLRKR